MEVSIVEASRQLHLSRRNTLGLSLAKLPEFLRSLTKETIWERAWPRCAAACGDVCGGDAQFRRYYGRTVRKCVAVLPANPVGRHRIFRRLDFFAIEGEQ